MTIGATVIGCRIVIATIFAGSATSKISSRARFDAFSDWLADLHRTPSAAMQPLAMAVVLAEAGITLCLGLSLVRGARSDGFAQAGSLSAAGLLLVFAFSTAILIRSGTSVRCMCFGRRGVPLGMRHIIRDLALASVAGVGSADISGALSFDERLVLMEIAVAIGTIVMFLDDIFALLSPWPDRRADALER